MNKLLRRVIDGNGDTQIYNKKEKRFRDRPFKVAVETPKEKFEIREKKDYECIKRDLSSNNLTDSSMISISCSDVF